VSAIGGVLTERFRQISEVSRQLGRAVDVAALGVTDRAGELPLGPAGEAVSPNGACRLFRAADGWMALNLARDEDRDLVPAWLEAEASEDVWGLISNVALNRTTDDLIRRAALLGLPAARVGEVSGGPESPDRLIRTGPWPVRPTPSTLRVVDLSALWAGPMCGAILAAVGAEVTKLDSVRRPEPARIATPGFDARMSGSKARLALDLATPEGKAELRARVMESDVVITSARRRGLRSIGLTPEAILAARPGLTWVAITGYGWRIDAPLDDAPERVAFGDDAAAAGGLVSWTDDGAPRFLGDALSDPLTGLAAAAAAMTGVLRGGGCLIDAAMAQAAANAAEARIG